MVNDLIVAVLVGTGAALQVSGLYLAYQLRKKLQTGTVKEAWDLLSMFIVLFIIGYIGYTIDILFDIAPIDPQLLNAIIFLFGGAFVAITAYLSKNAFTA